MKLNCWDWSSSIFLTFSRNIELIQFVLRFPWLLRFTLIIFLILPSRITHTYQHAPSKWLSRVSSPTSRFEIHIFGISYSFETYISGDIFFFFYLFFRMISFFPLLPSSFAIFFFLFIQRIHRCGYTKLERYYFCLHVNNSMSRVVCNAIVNTRVSLVSISMSRSMVLSNVLTSNRSFERYIFVLFLLSFFFI